MSNLSDLVGKAKLYSKNSYTLANNRFCDSNSAIYLTQSYLRAPSGINLTSDFTVTLWMYFKSFRKNSGLISFGNKSSKDTFSILLHSASQLTVLARNKKTSHNITTSKLQLNKWYHVALVFSRANAYVYVNGTLVCNGSLLMKNNVSRSINLIGDNADAIFDELKLYHGPMTANQVLDDYIASSSNGKLKLNIQFTVILQLFSHYLNNGYDNSDVSVTYHC